MTGMEHKEFKLNNRDEVVAFDKQLKDYCAKISPVPFNCISLVGIYDKLQAQSDGGRLFTAILDLNVNFALLHREISLSSVVWNDFFSKGKLEGGSVLDSDKKFYGKMELMSHLSAFVFRYRALWDKIMGVVVLAFAPQRYDEFIDADSRKKAFCKIASETPGIGQPFAATLKKLLSDFDNQFRTAEAHGTGRLRKWVFMMESMAENPTIEILDYWNEFNSFMMQLSEVLKSIRNSAKP